MAKQAEAERERRAKVIAAEGELQASEKLTQAAGVMSAQPGALQLRYLQTVAEIAAENNSTTLFPIPIDLLKAFLPEGRSAGGPPVTGMSDASRSGAGTSLPRPSVTETPPASKERTHAGEP